MNLFENFDFYLISLKKRKFSNIRFTPRGNVNLYEDTMENRWSSHAHKNWISKSLKMIQKQGEKHHKAAQVCVKIDV